MAEPLKSDPHPELRPDPIPDPNEKLVKVFDSEQESEALVVKGLLDSAGIDSDLKSASFLQDAFPGLGGMIILVREDDAATAQRLISDNRRSPSEEPSKDPDEDLGADADDDPTGEDETGELDIVIEERPPKA
jgi:hypothetical protein